MIAKRIGVIVGSTRPKRICRDIAEWVQSVARNESATTYELIDLAEIALPILDEPLMAALGAYEHEHTKRWSRVVQGFDGFVFVMPQYNWGYTAVVKNALDFLYAEWHGKAAATVTYGAHGGGKGADQLHEILKALGMRASAINPKIITPSDSSTQGRAIREMVDFESYASDLRAMARDLDTLLLVES